MSVPSTEKINFNFNQSECRVGDTVLSLNGIGFRKVFMVEAYRASLFSEKKISSKKELAALKSTKRFAISFTYGPIAIDRMKQAWNDAFLKNASNETMVSQKEIIDAFMNTITEYQKRDLIVYDITEDTVCIYTNNTLNAIITSAFLADAILNIFVGENPIDDNLKNGLLGH